MVTLMHEVETEVSPPPFAPVATLNGGALVVELAPPATEVVVDAPGAPSVTVDTPSAEDLVVPVAGPSGPTGGEGPLGPPGPPGPVGSLDEDLPDLTLIFENGLI